MKTRNTVLHTNVIPEHRITTINPVIASGVEVGGRGNEGEGEGEGDPVRDAHKFHRTTQGEGAHKRSKQDKGALNTGTEALQRQHSGDRGNGHQWGADTGM